MSARAAAARLPARLHAAQSIAAISGHAMAGEMSSQPLTAGMKMVVIGVMVAATNKPTVTAITARRSQSERVLPEDPRGDACRQFSGLRIAVAC
jgi:hypothetical protein